MKPSTVVILVMLAIIAYLLWKPGPPPPPEPVVIAPPLPTPLPVLPKGRVMAPPSRNIWAVSELKVLRGRVEEVTPDGLIISCEAPLPLVPRTESTPTGGAGGVDSTWMRDEVLKNRAFGPLMNLEKGMLKPTEWIPPGAVMGMALLMEHPAETSFARFGVVNVVAAPVEQVYRDGTRSLPAYTMKFATSAGEGTIGLWKWQPHGSLDGGAYNHK